MLACDVVVQVGDLMPAYEQVRSRLATNASAGPGGTSKLRMVPGNHDTEFDSLGVPRNWKMTTPDGLATLIGLDNSSSRLTDEGKALFAERGPSTFGFVFAHMAPWPIVLPDGSENRHTMIEGGPNADADWLVAQLKLRADAAAVGHYHGWSLQFAPWGPLIVEGRGGAATDLAFTLVTILPDGWVLHSVPA